MLDNLNLLLDELKNNPDTHLSRGDKEKICFYLETAIEILEKIKGVNNE